MGAAALETAENVYCLRLNPDLLISLAQSSRQQVRVAPVESATGEGNLAAMAGEAVGSACIEHVQFALAAQQRHQHGCGLQFGPGCGRSTASAG